AQKKDVLAKGLVKRRSSDEYSANVYLLPVPRGSFTKVASKDISPAHVGNLDKSVDIFVPNGTPVLAAYDGIVVRVRKDSKEGGTTLAFWDKGNYIEMKHENGEYTWYEHLQYDGVAVVVGQSVKQGNIIGYSGSTGITDEPHLHFQVNKYYGKGEDDYVTLKVRFQLLSDLYRKD
ncbi:MAG: M23 family metallopeptidase, partial [Candidatus Micrarchaeota archaeon]|nr:M23 family metallopeptidase [Candidatus Micrarchaeota archaeon]